MLCGSVLIAYVLRGVPASPYMPREAGLQVRSVNGTIRVGHGVAYTRYEKLS
jgi:hypothetical protein